MKRPLPIFLIFSVSIFCGMAATKGEITERRLDVRCGTVRVDCGTWRFIPEESPDDAPVYRMYGDSLICEVAGEERQTYGITSDSCHFLSSESRLWRVAPENPIPTSAFGHTLLGSLTEESDTGHYCHTYPIGNAGTYESTFPKMGALIIGGHESVAAFAVTELRTIFEKEGIGLDAEVITRERKRTRWFVKNDPLPVALQIEERAISGGVTFSTSQAAYTIDPSLIDYRDSTGGEGLPDTIEAVVEGGRLKISGEFQTAVDISAALSDINGIGVMAERFAANPETTVYEFHLPSLLPGNYILHISAGASIRRILVTVK